MTPSLTADPALAPWTLDARPRRAPLDDRHLADLVRYAVLAPSTHNTQPWRFRVRGGELEVRADRDRQLEIVDPAGRELLISCGAALANIRTAARAQGRLPRVEVLPDDLDPDLVARVRLGSDHDPTVADLAMLRAIPRRRTSRVEFDASHVGAALVARLVEAASAEGAWLEVLVPDQRTEVATLVRKAVRAQHSDDELRAELAGWERANAGSTDGVRGYGFGLNDKLARVTPYVTRTLDLGKARAEREQQLASDAPVLAVLGTSGDGPADWITAGQALETILLRARVEDVWAGYLNQPVQVPQLRSALAGVLREEGAPQVVLRFGHGEEPLPQPRRDVAEVLVTRR